MGLTRKCLEILAKSSCKIQLVTKSDLVTRDIDVLQNIPCVVSVTILTTDDVLSSRLEPGAPVSSKRLKAIEILVKAGIPTTVRIDPVIPSLNDDLNTLVDTVSELGVLHITCSTYKVKPDNWKRFSAGFPEVAEELKPLYFDEGERIGRSMYLPRNMRFALMKKVAELADEHNLKFGCCREGSNLNSGVCDGSWAVQKP
jgi:DNA repair photolyase